MREMKIESSATGDESEFGSGLVIDFIVKVNRNLPVRLVGATSEAIEASTADYDDYQETLPDTSLMSTVSSTILRTTTMSTTGRSFIGKLENRLWENESDLGRKIRLVFTFIGFIMSCIIFMCACICIYRKENFAKISIIQHNNLNSYACTYIDYKNCKNFKSDQNIIQNWSNRDHFKNGILQ